MPTPFINHLTIAAHVKSRAKGSNRVSQRWLDSPCRCAATTMPRMMAPVSRPFFLFKTA
ncbi:hypothetical protein BSLA_01f4584 [Burkholderia stabilis]|nr:hypothetical protein BSLA_01f4584 [Burkholderia stabilis]